MNIYKWIRSLFGKKVRHPRCSCCGDEFADVVWSDWYCGRTVFCKSCVIDIWGADILADVKHQSGTVN